MPHRMLGKRSVSILGLGGASFGNCYDNMSDDLAEEIIIEAIRSGINVIDTAYWYGQGLSEKRIAKALGNFSRNEYFIHTKLGRYERAVADMFDFSKARTLRAVDESLKALGIEYIDCMQIHDPEYADDICIILNETLPALEIAKKAGKIREIGLTGFPLSIHREILQKTTVPIDCCLTYCHYTLNDTSIVDSGFLNMLVNSHIGCMCASPLSMGLLSNRGPPSWHAAPQNIQDVAKQATAYCTEQGVDISTLALDFALSNKDISCTFVSVQSIEELRKNIECAYNIGRLSDTEMAVRDHIVACYFNPLHNQTWEGVEVQRYREYLRCGDHDKTLSTN